MTAINIFDDAARAKAEAVKVLSKGGIALIPTDTVYGLAARPDRPDAVLRLAEVKHRDPKKPIALLASGIEAVEARAGSPLPASAHRLAERFWPGALTMVIACADGTTEGFRVPDHDFIRELLADCGGLLRVTSANLSGETPAVDAADALEDAKIATDVALDGGPCAGGVASTVIRFDADGMPVILRLGAISKEALLEALGGTSNA